jgi:mycofactocin precursor peptide peptidase
VSRRLADLRWPDVPVQSILVVPIGSTEQHGHHLPLGTDTVIAVTLAEDLCTDHRFVLAPSLPYGSSGEHQSFRGTLSIGSDALFVVLVELIRSASLSFSGVVLVNGHGGNDPTMRRVQAHQLAEGRNVLAWSPSLPPGGDHHAGDTETSVMLGINPDAVSAERRSGPELTNDLLPTVVASGIGAVSETGVLGNPTTADAVRGNHILQGWCADLRTAGHRFCQTCLTSPPS